MTKRTLFKKRKSNIKFFFTILSFLSIFLVIFYYFNNKNYSFVSIGENFENFYIIPSDRGGEKVLNIDKKSLNYQANQSSNGNFVKNKNLKFSIQFYTNSQITNIQNYLKNITKSNDAIYNIEDFNILTLSTEIGIEYYLVYKNFNTKKEAKKYCLDFMNKIDNCLIVDTTKF